jgi:hypothetical protein
MKREPVSRPPATPKVKTAPAPFGLRIMAQRLDEHAQAFRSVPQAEMLRRLRGDLDQMMTVFEGLSADDWMGLLVPHKYMGPAPAFIFPTFQLVDYGVHTWDIREGLGLPNGLRGEVRGSRQVLRWPRPEDWSDQ